MAVPTQQGFGTLATGSAASISVSAPTCQNNDILILTVSTFAADAIAASNSYTELYDTGHVHVYWKRTTGTESTTSVSGASDSVTAFITVVRGCITSGSPLGSETPVVGTGTDATLEPGAFSTNAAEEAVIICYGIGDNNTVSGTTYGNLSNGSQNNGGTNTGSDTKSGLVFGTLAAAGSIGSPVVTQAASDSWRTYTFALKPPPPTWECGFTSEAKSSVVISGSVAEMWEAGFTSEAKSSVVVTGTVTEAAVAAINGLDSDIGTPNGGATVTIWGDNLSGVTQVLFGSSPAASFTYTAGSVYGASGGRIAAVSPSHAAGGVTLTVQTPSGNPQTSYEFMFAAGFRDDHASGFPSEFVLSADAVLGRIIMPEAGSITSLTFYVENSDTQSHDVRVAVYDDSSLDPQTRLALSSWASVASSSADEVTVALDAPLAVDADVYWIGIEGDSASLSTFAQESGESLSYAAVNPPLGSYIGGTATVYGYDRFVAYATYSTSITYEAGFTTEAKSAVVITGSVTEASGTTYEAGFTSESKTRVRVSAPGQPFLRNTLEGNDGTTVTNANTAPDNFTQVSVGSGATFAFDTARAVQGASSVEIAATVAGQGASAYWDFTATPDVFTRAYVYMTAAPSGYHRLITLRAASADIASLRVNTSGQAYLDTGGGTSAAIALNQWVRVELAAYNISGTAGYIEARLFNDPRSDTPTSVIGEYETTGMGECVRATFGAISTCPADLHIWMDQFAVASDFWLGSEPFTLEAGFTSESVSKVQVGSSGTVTIYASNSGGQTPTSGTSLENLWVKEYANGINTEAVSYIRLTASTYWEIYEIHLAFLTDSTNIPADATITDIDFEYTRPTWAGALSSGDYEVYLNDWSGGGITTYDHLTSAELTTLHNNDALVALSDAAANTGSITTWTFTSEAAFIGLVNRSGSTYLSISPTNMRTQTGTSINSTIYSQFESTEAYRPRLVIDWAGPGAQVTHATWECGFTSESVSKVEVGEARTFGQTTRGDSIQQLADYSFYVTRFTLSDTAYVTSVVANLGEFGGNPVDVRAVIYDDTGTAGKPGAKRTSSVGEHTLHGWDNGEETIAVHPVVLSPGDYYIGIVVEDAAPADQDFWHAAGGTSWFATGALSDYASPPATWSFGSDAAQARTYSVYANYTTALVTHAVWEAGFTSESVSKVQVGGDAIPLMTSATTPSGVASASATYEDANSFVWGAFDKNSSATWWASYAPPQWLAYEFASAKVIGSYAMDALASGTTGLPTAFTFQGSNNGTDWTDLDSQTGLSWSNGERKTFSFPNATSYLHYRIYMTAVVGGSWTQVPTLEMASVMVTHATWEAGFTSEAVSSVVIAGTVTEGGGATTWEAGFTSESLSSVVVSGSKTDWTAEAGFTSEALSAVVVAGAVTHWTAEAGFTSEAKSAVVVAGTKTDWIAEAGFTSEAVSAVVVTGTVTEIGAWECGFTSEAKSAVVIAAGPISYGTGFTSEAKSSVVVSGAGLQWVAEAGFTSEAKSSVVVSGQKVEWNAEAGFTSEAKSAVEITATKTDWVAEAGFTSEAKSAVAIAGVKLGTQECGFTSEAKSAVVVTAGPTTSSRGFTSESVTSVVVTGQKTDWVAEAGFTSEAKSSVVVSGTKAEAVWECGFTSEAKSAVTVAGQKTDWVAEAGFTSEAVTKVEVIGYKEGAVYTWDAGFTSEAKSAVTVSTGGISYGVGFTTEGKSSVVVSATKADWTAEASFTSEAVTAVSITGTATHAIWEAGFTSASVTNITIDGQKNGVFLWDCGFTSEARSSVTIRGSRTPRPNIEWHVGAPESGWRTSIISRDGGWSLGPPESGWTVRKPVT